MTHPAAKNSQLTPRTVRQHHNRFGWRDDQSPGIKAGFALPEDVKKWSQRPSGNWSFGSVSLRATRR